MAKTIEITVTCEGARIVATKYNEVKMVLENPKIEDILPQLTDSDIITHVRSEGYKPDEVFQDEDLNEWAYNNGFTKSK